MRSKLQPKRTALAILISAIGVPAITLAAPIDLVQYPAGTAYKAPIPNVIMSIDTSGSMGTQDSGTSKTRLQFVKDGLKSVLIDSTTYDDQFRLAWQSFACNGIPSNSGGCGNNNSMGKFSGTHKSNFGTWIQQTSANGITPTQVLAWNAGKYLQTTGANSPWNATPGTADSSPVTCRRAYHILLTDGGWNFTYPSALLTGTSFKTDMTLANSSATLPIQNFDGKPIAALPTPAPATPPRIDYGYGTRAYSTTSDETLIYRDSIGTRKITTGSGSSTAYYAYPTLADIAFHFWATDLQPGISNEVIPKIRKTGSETFTNGGISKTYSEYWNPKNDPAEWQHLVQYTIGYGATASALRKIGGASNPTYNGNHCSQYSGTQRTACEASSISPQWTGGIFGMYGTGFESLAVGNTKWDDVTSSNADNSYDDFRPQEMWHMAINSRGKYYPVTGDLAAVFKDIFDDIIADTTAPISGFVSASGSVSRVGTYSYQTSYTAADQANSNDNRWYGYITSNSISTTGTTTPNPNWGTTGTAPNVKNISTADKLDSIANINNRLILSYDLLSTSTQKGISFKWANLTNSTTGPSARMWLNKGIVGTGTPAAIAAAIAGDGQGENRLNFIRGDRTKEGANGGPFRNRKSRQGDIVNSAIWYVDAPANGHTTDGYKTFASNYRNRLPMVYVGGNDGMLHGFSGYDGTEKIAYVPHGVIQNLATLSDTGYTHRYYVDGSPMTGDVYIIGASGTPEWRTYLVGTLGAGGRGYFVLDVTEPGSTPTKTGVADKFEEANASSLVVMDKTAAAASDAAPPTKPADPNAHPNIGHIFGTPVVAESNQQRALQITRTNDNRWALITGNGYNSANELPALLIQYLDSTKELKIIPTDATACPASAGIKGNGLSTPQFLDVNSDGIPDFVYAGDLCGNMWKFDISHVSGDTNANGIADSTHWGVSFAGKPLFTAATSTSRQPITAPPVLRPNRTVGGLMVAFGTGQTLTELDRGDTSTQTVYSVLDNTRYQIESTGANKSKVKVKASNPTPTEISNGRTDLVPQSVDGGAGAGTTGTGSSAGRAFWTLTSQEVTYTCEGATGTCAEKKGWYLDLPVAGERVTTAFDFYDGSNILEIISEKPAAGSATASGAEVCAPQPQPAQPFRTLLNISSGAPAKSIIMDVSGDGQYNASDRINGAPAARMTASSKELRFGTKNEQIRKGGDGKEDKLNKLAPLQLRPNWRQVK